MHPVTLTFLLAEEVTPDLFAHRVAEACACAALRIGEAVQLPSDPSQAWVCVAPETLPDSAAVPHFLRGLTPAAAVERRPLCVPTRRAAATPPPHAKTRVLLPRASAWVVADADGRPLARFGISTRTRALEDIRHAVEFANLPELRMRVMQALAEIEVRGLSEHARVLLQRVREAAEGCAVPIPGLDAALAPEVGAAETIATDGRTVGEIAKELERRIGGVEYVEAGSSGRAAPWPANPRWLACYAVLGGNEGHYVHVDALHQQASGPATVQQLLIIKVLTGREHALAVASLCARLLGAV